MLAWKLQLVPDVSPGQAPVFVSSQVTAATPASLIDTHGSSVAVDALSVVAAANAPPGDRIAASMSDPCFQAATAVPDAFIARSIWPVQNDIGGARLCGAVNEPPAGRIAHIAWHSVPGPGIFGCCSIHTAIEFPALSLATCSAFRLKKGSLWIEV